MIQILKYLDKKTLDIISISIILLLTVSSYTMFLKGDISRHTSLKHRLIALKSSSENSALSPEGQKDRTHDIASLEKEISDYKNVFQSSNKTSYFLNYVTALARRNRIEIATIEPGEVSMDDTFVRNTYTTSLTGGFYDVYNFLYHIEEDWKAVRIERVVMDKDIEGSRIHVTLTVAVFSI